MPASQPFHWTYEGLTDLRRQQKGIAKCWGHKCCVGKCNNVYVWVYSMCVAHFFTLFYIYIYVYAYIPVCVYVLNECNLCKSIRELFPCWELTNKLWLQRNILLNIVQCKQYICVVECVCVNLYGSNKKTFNTSAHRKHYTRRILAEFIP